MDLFTYLMAKNDHNTSVNKDLFSYLLGKNQSGTYTDYSGTSISVNNSKKAKMQLSLKGNTSQTGTPTPSTPIDVNVVSGDNEVVVCGKNLWDEILEHGGYNLTTGAKENTNYYRSVNYIPVKQNTNYSLYKPTGMYTRILFYDSSKTFISAPDVIYTNRVVSTFTSPNNAYYMTFYIDYGSATYNNNIMLVEGTYTSETIPPYEPYQSQTYEIDLPVENLIPYPYDFTTGTYRGVTVTDNGDGSIILNGTGTGTQYLNYATNYSLKAGTYTVSLGQSGIEFAINSSGGMVVSLSTSEKTKTFTLNDDRTVTMYSAIRENATYNNLLIKPQLEKGTKANSYTPYGTAPIELCKIGTYQDYFTKNSDGEWCKYNAIGKVVLDGTESDWRDFFSTQGIFVTSNITPAINNTATLNGLSNRFQNVIRNYMRNNLATVDNSFSIYATELVFANRSITGTANFRTWLGTNKPEVYYVLQTPYLSLIEDNNLIEQLDNLQNAMSYSGTTNINQINNDLPFNIDAKIKVGN